jgi:hypothetical protein
MQPSAVWVIYTLMFGPPMPTLNGHEFTTESACIIYLRSYSQQVIDAFQLVCAKRSVRATSAEDSGN